MAILLFTVLYPTFGSSPSNEQQALFETFENYEDGKFINLPMGKPEIDINVLAAPENSDSEDKEMNPGDQLPVVDIDWDNIGAEEDSLTWLGHSTFIMSLDNNKILIDPMLGPVASPVSFIGPKRYGGDLLHLVDEMPEIDAVFITHDHYDHLDYESIKKLDGKVAHYFVPYGVGSHLTGWGVAEDKITEMNWWDEKEYQGLTVALVPAKHFSGRGILNRSSTLWGGWVLAGEETRFYISGDSGYDKHFKEIGNKYGPFDIALIEGGQYDERWPESHMIPEESVQASIDVQAEQMMLIHWAGFTLARHSWTEPIERALVATEENDVDLFAPRIGETVPLDGDVPFPVSTWWR
ncbi:MBL fold metallo-hydrolase [Metaplanococcus flavidus]|uniref:MBL fold metallo-hydrolase n=1 Tax=Metaplanococcus flavidus TaxID=569883 RepID=A0ABW3LDE3_9BACL